MYYLSQLCGDPQRFDSFLQVSSRLPETGPVCPPLLCPNSQGCPSLLVVRMEWRGPVSGAGTRPSLRAVPGVLPPLRPSVPPSLPPGFDHLAGPVGQQWVPPRHPAPCTPLCTDASVRRPFPAVQAPAVARVVGWGWCAQPPGLPSPAPAPAGLRGEVQVHQRGSPGPAGLLPDLLPGAEGAECGLPGR